MPRNKLPWIIYSPMQYFLEYLNVSFYIQSKTFPRIVIIWRNINTTLYTELFQCQFGWFHLHLSSVEHIKNQRVLQGELLHRIKLGRKCSSLDAVPCQRAYASAARHHESKLYCVYLESLSQ